MMPQNVSVRRARAHISQLGMTLLHDRSPFVSAFWSFAFPGCGHLMQGRTAKGLILIIWELVVNNNAKVNLCIMYSLQGQFDLARQVINLRWFLLYVPLYVFAIWDSYRGTVDLNHHYELANREDAEVKPLAIGTGDINHLDKRHPWLAAVWSILSPGLGHLYIHQTVTGIFFIGWTIVVMYNAHALPAVHYTLAGSFLQAKQVLSMQWLMYLPSIYGFVIHNTCLVAVEYNKLLEKEQSRLLRTKYQHPSFKMPL